jgi:branched-chain amino acid transport system permease protein
MQLLINILILSAVTLIVGLSSSIIYTTTRCFDLAQASTLSFASYFTYVLLINFRFPLILAISLAVLGGVAIAVVCELVVYRYMRNRGFPPFTLLIASIGLYTIFQNLLSLCFGDGAKSFRTGEVKAGHQLAGAYVTDIQIVTIVVGALVFVTVLLLLHRTTLGKQIRAVSSNLELCNIFGINSGRIILWAVIISSSLAGTAGILISWDLGMTPSSGFNYFLWGVVAMIIGGVASYRGLVVGSILLTSAQHLAAYYFDAKWMAAVAYIVLILFLIWKPLGFNGRRLKKVEV